MTRAGLREDSRLSVIRLTPRGRTRLEAVRPLAAGHEIRLLRGIDSKTFKSHLDQLMLNAEALLGQERA